MSAKSSRGREMYLTPSNREYWDTESTRAKAAERHILGVEFALDSGVLGHGGRKNSGGLTIKSRIICFLYPSYGDMDRFADYRYRDKGHCMRTLSSLL